MNFIGFIVSAITSIALAFNAHWFTQPIIPIQGLPENAEVVTWGWGDYDGDINAVITRNDTRHTLTFHYEYIVHDNWELEPRINLFLEHSSDTFTNYYFIGEFVSGTPTLNRNYVYDVGMDVPLSVFMWWGGGGYVVFIATDADKVFVYAVYADVPLEEAVPVIKGIIPLE